MNIIGISGKSGSGKSVLKNLLVSEYGAIHLSFADQLKQEIIAFLYNSNVKYEQKNFYGNTRDREVILQIDKKYLSNMQLFIDKFAQSIKGDIVYFTPRSLMQYWGTDFRRSLNKQYWIDKVEQKLNKISKDLNKNKIFVIDDVRFKNEIEWLKKKKGHTIRIIRPEQFCNKINTTHASETDIDDVTFDVYIVSTPP